MKCSQYISFALFLSRNAKFILASSADCDAKHITLFLPADLGYGLGHGLDRGCPFCHGFECGRRRR